MRDLSDLYYECHVTIDPVFGTERQLLTKLIKPFGFKLAKLVMLKKGARGAESQRDTFFTAHSKNYSQLQQRMVDCVRAIQKEGFAIRRYKIEDTIIDSKIKDILEIVG